MHIDDWLNKYDASPPEDPLLKHAHRFLTEARKPAHMVDHEWMANNPLFCTFSGSRFRVTGASRLGDIYLNDDFSQDRGYNIRIGIDFCSNWGNDETDL